MLGKDIEVPATNCLVCNAELDGCSNVAGRTEKPVEGSLSICVYCGNVSKFNSDLTLRELSADESKSLLSNRVITAIREAISLVNKTAKKH